MNTKKATKNGNRMAHKQQSGKKPGKWEGRVSKYLQSFLDGSILSGEGKIVSLPYVLLLTMLAMFYIGNNYYAQRKIREMNEIENDMKELRYEYRSTNSNLMYESKQSEIARKLRGTGIIESTEPPKKLFEEEKQD